MEQKYIHRTEQTGHTKPNCLSTGHRERLCQSKRERERRGEKRKKKLQEQSENIAYKRTQV